MPTLLEKIFHTPVYVYQMGKVGSTSVKETLKANTRSGVIHAHNYQRMLYRDRWFLNFSRMVGRPVKVICPVRDPISRNVSGFFQTFMRDTGFELSERNWTVDELRELFLERYPHSEPLKWFDLRFKPYFGLDIFSVPFPIDQKFRFYRIGSVEVLIYRSDVDRTTQLELISKLVGQNINQWTHANIGQQKSYSELYKRFCSEVSLPGDYLDELIGSKYAKHFWTPDELKESASRWRAR